MYRVRLIYDVPNWAYHRRCLAIYKYAPSDFHVHMGAWQPGWRQLWPAEQQYDLIFHLPPDQVSLRRLLSERGQEAWTVILGGLNIGWGHHVERLKMARKASDHLVVNNRDCYERLGKPEDMTQISNGVDRNIYKNLISPADRKPKVIWTGSQYHCKNTNIKGYHEFLLPLKERLAAKGMELELRKVDSTDPKRCFSTEQMVDWYNSATIYVCASSSEGTPNPALEAASCGCVIVSTRVGNMPELIERGVNGELVDRSVDALEDGILRCQEKYLELQANMEARIAEWDWSKRALQYYDMFRFLIASRKAKR